MRQSISFQINSGERSETIKIIEKDIKELSQMLG